LIVGMTAPPFRTGRAQPRNGGRGLPAYLVLVGRSASQAAWKSTQRLVDTKHRPESASSASGRCKAEPAAVPDAASDARTGRIVWMALQI